MACMGWLVLSRHYSSALAYVLERLLIVEEHSWSLYQQLPIIHTSPAEAFATFCISTLLCVSYEQLQSVSGYGKAFWA